MVDTRQAVYHYFDTGSCKKAAERLDCSHSAVLYHLKKAGIDTSQKSLPRDRIVRLYREGCSMDEVGKALGCSPNSVSRVLADRGVESRDGGRSPWLELPVDELVREWREEGMGVTELADKYECSRTTIQKRIARHA